MIWTTDFAYFLLAKAGCSNVLTNCSLCGTKAILCFSAGPVCSSFSAEACAIVQALRWSWQHQQVCSFSFPPLRLSPHCVLFRLQTLWYIWQELSSLFCFTIRLRRVCGNTFLPANDAADELASEGGLLLQFLVVSLLPLVSTLLLDWRRTVPSKLFSTQVPSVSIEQLELVLPGHACYALSHLRFNGHRVLLNSCPRIGRSENPSCSGHPTQNTSSHSALSCYGLFKPLALWLIFLSLRSLGLVLAELPGF